MTTETDELLPKSINQSVVKYENKMSSADFFYIFMFTLISISLNFSALGIGVSYSNNTCYQNKKIISLSNWLILLSVCFLVYQLSYMFFLTTTLYCRNIIPNFNEFYECNAGIIIMMKITITVMNLVMFIIGIIELTHQYPSCHNVVHPVTSMAIVITIINAIHYANMLI